MVTGPNPATKINYQDGILRMVCVFACGQPDPISVAHLPLRYLVATGLSPPSIARAKVSPVTSFISQKELIKSFCRSQYPSKSVNLLFTSVMIKVMLTDLCGNRSL